MTFTSYIFQELIPRLLELFTDPWLHRESLWIILSTIFIAVLIEMYFGRYKSEELGWNTAFSNSISLFWVGVILLRVIFAENNIVMILSDPVLIKKLIIIGIFLFWIFLLLFFNFFHILPKRFAFLISSATFINPLAYVLIAIILGDFPLDGTTSLAAFFLFNLTNNLLYFFGSNFLFDCFFSLFLLLSSI